MMRKSDLLGSASSPQVGAMDALLHDHARETAKAGDAAWFAANPGRDYRVRRSVPREFAGWGEFDHLRMPYTLAVMHQTDHGFSSAPFTATRMPADNDETLRGVWQEMQRLAGIPKEKAYVS